MNVHIASAKIGVLITNIGTPAAPDPGPVREYLREFLSDQRIVDYPRWLWLPLLHGIILRVRPRRSARLYRSIWTDDGSPLKTIMERIATKLGTQLNTVNESRVVIEVGMRYGKPSIPDALNMLCKQNVGRIIVVPLYPQYSGTTTGTTHDAVADALRELQPAHPCKLVPNYHDHPAYIDTLDLHIRGFWKQHGKPEHLLLSFHGIPARFARQGDPYREQCERTAELLADSLELDRDEWTLGYQSRFGPEPWLQPYTDETLAKFGQQGLQDLHIIAPGFSVDCLETLEELQIEGCEIFHEAGGGTFQYIPALNDSSVHIAMLVALIKECVA